MTEPTATISRFDAEVLFGLAASLNARLLNDDPAPDAIERIVRRFNEDAGLIGASREDTIAYLNRLTSRMHVALDPELASSYTTEELAQYRPAK